MNTRTCKTACGVFAATLAALLLVSGTAQATDFGAECAYQDKLKEALVLLEYANPEKDLPALTGKIDAAFFKVEAEGKYCDGIQKIEDFRLKLSKLVYASKPKAWESAEHPGTLACLFAGSDSLLDQWFAVTSQSGGCEDAGDPPRGKGPKNK